MNQNLQDDPIRISPLGKKEIAIALIITLFTGALIAYKVLALGYSMTTIEPEDGYYVRLIMDVQGNGRDCTIRLALPVQSERQTIIHEKEVGESFRYSISPGRIGKWYAQTFSGKQTITFGCLAQTRAKTYPMPEDADIPTTYPVHLQNDLIADDHTQSKAPEIVQKANSLAPPGTKLTQTLKAVFNYCMREVRYMKVRGTTDAITAFRLGEASCNGKVRLMVAMLRAKGIPARMANGLILETSRKRTSHAWVEAWVLDRWVPFCPTNDYFAQIPDTYLELAKGDVAIITHSPSIGFDWKWIIHRQLNHREKAVLSNTEHPFNILRAWTTLKDYHVSLDLIMVILMIPIGATVVAFARNFVGLVPFGTFMPALVAVSFRDTGFPLGAVMFATVILVGCCTNLLLMKLRLLHIPRLTIIITVVVMSILSLSIVCIRLGLSSGAAVSLFPMAILSLTTERFTLTMIVEGWHDAVKRLIVTFLVSSLCFLVINWTFLQLVVTAYPEILLLNVAINLVLGSWTGLRLVELWRFRDLLGSAGAGFKGRGAA